MFITFGTRFCGKIATVNNQWIETKFFSVMFIPIFPISSMFVTSSQFKSRRGFTIALNTKSVIAVYGRLLSIGLAAFFLFLSFENSKGYGQSHLITSLIYLLLAVLMSGLCYYFYVEYGKASPEDISLRNKMGYLTGHFALPHWFDHGYLRNMLGELELKYRQKYPDNNWKTDLEDNATDSSKHQLLFGLALFNCMVYDSPENDQLYIKADQLFVLK